MSLDLRYATITTLFKQPNIVGKGFFLVNHRQPKFSINQKLIRVVSYFVILNMAVNIKDLYGNSGNKLKKIKYSLYLIYLVFFFSFRVISISFNPLSPH